jgi:hypothetical protein
MYGLARTPVTPAEMRSLWGRVSSQGTPPQLAAMSGILRRVNLKKDQSNTHVLRRTDARLLSFLPKTTARDMSLFCPIKGGGGRDLCSTDPRPRCLCETKPN